MNIYYLVLLIERLLIVIFKKYAFIPIHLHFSTNKYQHRDKPYIDTTYLHSKRIQYFKSFCVLYQPRSISEVHVAASWEVRGSGREGRQGAINSKK